jgi:myosin heavy subunit
MFDFAHLSLTPYRRIFHSLTHRYAGVLETVRIRGAGFPNRRLLPAFLVRYAPLAPIQARSTLVRMCVWV